MKINSLIVTLAIKKLIHHMVSCTVSNPRKIHAINALTCKKMDFVLREVVRLLDHQAFSNLLRLREQMNIILHQNAGQTIIYICQTIWVELSERGMESQDLKVNGNSK
jgi:hypothetical protein